MYLGPSCSNGTMSNLTVTLGYFFRKLALISRMAAPRASLPLTASTKVRTFSVAGALPRAGAALAGAAAAVLVLLLVVVGAPGWGAAVVAAGDATGTAEQAASRVVAVAAAPKA